MTSEMYMAETQDFVQRGMGVGRKVNALVVKRRQDVKRAKLGEIKRKLAPSNIRTKWLEDTHFRFVLFSGGDGRGVIASSPEDVL